MHLVPLYRFLQRSAAAQVALELCASLAPSEEEAERSAGSERRCLALATVPRGA